MSKRIIKFSRFPYSKNERHCVDSSFHQVSFIIQRSLFTIKKLYSGYFEKTKEAVHCWFRWVIRVPNGWLLCRSKNQVKKACAWKTPHLVCVGHCFKVESWLVMHSNLIAMSSIVCTHNFVKHLKYAVSDFRTFLLRC